ncbi:MAG: type III pantothenate kinase [Cyanobacteriota bacterium]|nr:type III pantothenate kinase [Cyanobacteriota bacterium]
MRPSSPRCVGRRHLKVEVLRHCLLIGNSRWHWAEYQADEWQFCHSVPNPLKLQTLEAPLVAWAAVGPIPAGVALDPNRRLGLGDVPLTRMPVWLGIDRALAAWGALRRAHTSGLSSSGLLVADAGTVLSLTRVTAAGDFAGGQLVPGLRLQLRAMAQGTQGLIDPGIGSVSAEPFPFATAEAMRRGSLQALLGTLLEAQREAALPLWLCGGDASVLQEALSQRGLDVVHHPNLVLEGMVDVHDRISRAPSL